MSKVDSEFTTFRDAVEPLLDDAEGQIQGARARVKELQSIKEELVKLSEYASHFDSVASGTLRVDEEQKRVTLRVSKHTLDGRFVEILEEHHWTETEIEWLEGASVFQAELTMRYDL